MQDDYGIVGAGQNESVVIIQLEIASIKLKAMADLKGTARLQLMQFLPVRDAR